MSRARARWRAPFAPALCLLLAVVVAACGSSRSARHGAAVNRPGANHAGADATAELISFGTSTCAPNWRPHTAGQARFQVSNGSDRSATVYLFRSASGATIATLHEVKPHSVRALTVDLAPGVGYSWACDLSGYPDHVSDSERAPRSGQSGSGPVVVPVYVATLIPPLNSYRRYVTRLLDSLQQQAGRLLSATRAGGVASQARAAWLTAHMTWLRIGQDDGAYGAFGELGQRIDGTAAGLVGGTSSPSFTGFHRVEHDLWAKHDMAAAQADTTRLVELVAKLRSRTLSSELPATRSGMTTFTIRTHEVLEDALRDTLSGDDDYGSGTALASLTADVAATRKFLALLAPELDPRAPTLVGSARRELTAVSAAIGRARHGAGWPPIQTLPERERQQINQTVGATLQTLSRVPDLLGIGGT